MVQQGSSEPGDRAAANEGWLQRAAFSVWVDARTEDDGGESWQTRIYHEESGEEIVVDGRSIDWLVRVLQQLGLGTGHRGTRHRGTAGAAVVVDVAAVRVVRADGGRVRVEMELEVRGQVDLERVLGAEVLRAALGAPADGEQS